MNDFVKIRLYAAARAAAGQSEIMVKPGSLDDILSDLARNNAQLGQVFLQCSFLVDGLVIHEKDLQIQANSIVDVLPPFAGG